MRQKSQKILKLLSNEARLTEERSKALKISKEIQGFGNSTISPTSSTPSSSSSSKSSRASSFSSYSCDSPSWSRQDELKHSNMDLDDAQAGSPSTSHKEMKRQHLWNSPIEEDGSLLEAKVDDHHVKENSPSRWSSYSRFFRNAKQSAQASGLRSLSDVGKAMKKKFDRQLSLGF